MDGQGASAKRRRPNFSDKEQLSLIAEVTKRKDIILGKIDTTITTDLKNIAWESIKNAVNLVAKVNRDTNELRRKFVDLRANVKKKRNSIKKSNQEGTPGVSCHFSAVEEAMFPLIGNQKSLSTLVNCDEALIASSSNNVKDIHRNRVKLRDDLETEVVIQTDEEMSSTDEEPVDPRSYPAHDGGCATGNGSQQKGSDSPPAGARLNSLSGPCIVKKQVHCSSILDQLLCDQCYTDVILTADGRTFHAHKIVLCMGSSYFRRVLSDHGPGVRHVVVLRDVPQLEMANILHFLYTGEATMDAAELPSFMRTAQLLEIRSLCDADPANDSTATTLANQIRQQSHPLKIQLPPVSNCIDDKSRLYQAHGQKGERAVSGCTAASSAALDERSVTLVPPSVAVGICPPSRCDAATRIQSSLVDGYPTPSCDSVERRRHPADVLNTDASDPANDTLDNAIEIKTENLFEQCMESSTSLEQSVSDIVLYNKNTVLSASESDKFLRGSYSDYKSLDHHVNSPTDLFSRGSTKRPFPDDN